MNRYFKDATIRELEILLNLIDSVGPGQINWEWMLRWVEAEKHSWTVEEVIEDLRVNANSNSFRLIL